MKKVIINADDFGLVQGVNEGIIKAHKEGILTSTTLMANMPGFDQAVELAGAHPNLGVGVHLNILRGQPLSPVEKVESLLSKDRCFVPSVPHLLRRILLKRIGIDEVEREFRAQVEKVKNTGLSPSHIDSEKHIHMIRPLFRIVLKIAKEYRINRVRFIQECCLFLRPGQMLKSMLISLSSASLKKRMTNEGVRSPDRFYGVCDSGRITAAKLKKVLHRVKEGVTEIMVHPGFITQDMLELETRIGPYYINKYREKELSALLDERLPDVIADLGIRLINFSHL
ncbi:MAG: ChbG/HpnK family deacetylase [Candidatus Aminicenantes bacterium]|jgi:hopanoid biosynthesis associated protein HpnK